MFNRNFWLGDNGALVRAVRTFAQTAAAMLTVSTFSPFDIGSWGNTLVVSGTAALVSLLMSFDRKEALLTPPPKALEEQPADFVPAQFAPAHSSVGCGDCLR